MRCHTASRPLRVCCVLLYTSAPCWFGPRCLLSPNQHDGSANTSKSAWSCESLPCSAVPALVRRGRYKGPAQHLCGGIVLSSLGDAPASPPANTTLNTHAILLGASSLTSAGVRRWRFYVPVHKISYGYFPPGCGRSWTERAKRQRCHQVCRRPLKRVAEALRRHPEAKGQRSQLVTKSHLVKTYLAFPDCAHF